MSGSTARLYGITVHHTHTACLVPSARNTHTETGTRTQAWLTNIHTDGTRTRAKRRSSTEVLRGGVCEFGHARRPIDWLK
eukprot:3476432-Prymnesium_polylepis.1